MLVCVCVSARENERERVCVYKSAGEITTGWMGVETAIALSLTHSLIDCLHPARPNVFSVVVARVCFVRSSDKIKTSD